MGNTHAMLSVPYIPPDRWIDTINLMRISRGSLSRARKVAGMSMVDGTGERKRIVGKGNGDKNGQAGSRKAKMADSMPSKDLFTVSL